MIPIRNHGRLLKTDGNGFLIGDTHPDHIVPPWRAALDFACQAIVDHLGATVHSVYIRSSVPRDLAIEGLCRISIRTSSSTARQKPAGNSTCPGDTPCGLNSPGAFPLLRAWSSGVLPWPGLTRTSGENFGLRRLINNRKSVPVRRGCGPAPCIDHHRSGESHERRFASREFGRFPRNSRGRRGRRRGIVPLADKALPAPGHAPGDDAGAGVIRGICTRRITQSAKHISTW